MTFPGKQHTIQVEPITTEPQREAAPEQPEQEPVEQPVEPEKVPA